MDYSDENQELFAYRLGLIGHHVYSVLTPYADTKDLIDYLQRTEKSDKDHIEYFISMDKKQNVMDIGIRIKTIAAIDALNGKTPLRLADIRKRKEELRKNTETNGIKATIGQVAKRISNNDPRRGIK